MNECKSCGQLHGFHLESCKSLSMNEVVIDRARRALEAAEDFFIPKRSDAEDPGSMWMTTSDEPRACINISSSIHDSTISFMARNGQEVLKIDVDGNIFVKGNIVINDKQFVDEFRNWFLANIKC